MYPSSASTALRVLMRLSYLGARILWVYSMLIWLRIMLGWFIPYPRKKGFIYYLYKIVDAYLNLFRGKLLVAGRLDFSPIIGIAIIEVFQALLMYFAQFGRITLSYCLYLFLNMIWSYCIQFFIIFIGILLLIRTICSLLRNPNAYSFGSRITASVTPITDLVRRIFFPHRIPRDSTLSIISLTITILLYFALKYLFYYLGIWALRIPF